MTRTQHVQAGATPLRAALYVRVSTDEQAAEGVSLAAQEESLRAYARARGWSVASCVSDSASAKSLRRPGLERLLDGVRAGEYDALLVWRLDRLTRRVADLSTLMDVLGRHEVALVSLGESLDATSAAGRLMLHILASVAQWEREAIGERVASALRHLRLEGRPWNHAPFGYRRVGDRLVEDDEARRVLASIRAWRRDGLSLRAIAARLEAQGIPPARGGRWRPEVVRRLANAC